MTAVDLSQLPRPAARRLAVRVTRDAERQIRGGHPWVFAGSITSVGDDGAPGDLAVVFDAKRDFLAIGLYDPASPIRIRVLHQGAPTPVDDSWWSRQIAAALDRRRALASSSATTGYRCVHGENDGLPGLVLDRYGSTYVLKLYTAALVPHLATIAGTVEQLLRPDALVLRLSRGVRAQVGLREGSVLLGALESRQVRFVENDLALEADVVSGQKTGYFLDQRENRARVRALTHGADVLDVFSCTGGFTLHAAAGGARRVRSVDLSRHAIDATRRNLQLNERSPAVRSCRHEASVGDAFSVLRDLARRGDRFDVVVLDPPSFAAKRSDVTAGLAAYRRLTGLGLDVVRPGGVLVQSSCSSRISADEFHAAFAATARERGAQLDVFDRTGHAVDHPVGFAHGAYLNTAFARVDDPGGGAHRSPGRTRRREPDRRSEPR